MGRPEPTAYHRPVENREVAPEPVDKPLQRLPLLHLRRPVQGKDAPFHNPLLVDQNLERSAMDVIESGGASLRQFPFHAIRKDEHDHVEAELREVLEENRFAEAAQECPPLSEEGLVVFVSYDQVQIEIGILVGRSRCVRTTDEGGHDARVFSTGSHETVECHFSITSDNQGSTPFPSNA